MLGSFSIFILTQAGLVLFFKKTILFGKVGERPLSPQAQAGMVIEDS